MIESDADLIDVLQDMDKTRTVVRSMKRNGEVQDIEIHLDNIEWNLRCSRQAFFVKCNTGTDGTYWSVDAHFDIKYTAAADDRILCKESIEHTFHDSKQRKFPLEWRDAEVQQVTITIEVSVKKIKNLNRTLIDPLDRTLLLSGTSVILLVRGQKFRVNKEYLSLHSSVFNQIFNSLINKDKEEIEIGDICPFEMLLFLRVLYFRELTAKAIITMFAVMKLADRYKVQWVMEFCENWLVLVQASSAKRPADYGFPLLHAADKYKLNDLQCAVIETLKRFNVKKAEIEVNPEFMKLSNETKFAIYKELK